MKRKTDLSLLYEMQKAGKLLQRKAEEKLNEYDLTLPLLSALEVIINNAPITQAGLAAELSVTGGNITFIVDKLESGGYVKRIPGTVDRRNTLLAPTSKGENSYKNVTSEISGYIRNLTSGLKMSEKQELIALLQRLMKAVSDDSN